MEKILTGASYDLPRLVGIKSEMWARITGKEPPIIDTQFATGNIIVNTISGNVGLVINTDSQYFNIMFEPHKSRLIDIVNGDGWGSL